MNNRTRIAAATLLAAAAAAALAAPAQAHVTVDPEEATQGDYATLNVKVPNERDNASTVGLELHLDPDHPLASVSPQPVPGWRVRVETTELDQPIEVHGSPISEVPGVITWTATGGGIGPGMFQQFPLSVGPLPEDADQLVLDAVQTYDNGEVVRWIEEPTGGEEPEYPSPVLRLAAAPAEGEGGGDDGAAVETGDTGDTENVSASEAPEADASDTTARVMAGVGIAVGVAGVAFGLLAGRRRRTTTPS
jgi:uncharacterized protein YcnI